MTAKDGRLKLPKPDKARIAKGLTQRALAALVPTTQCTVYRVEKSGKYPRQAALRAAYFLALGLTEPKVAK